MRTCSNPKHVWHVTAVDGKLDVSGLRHGRRCACGSRVIATVPCDRGCGHKTTVTEGEFKKLMEDR
jgi:hypothetical protein